MVESPFDVRLQVGDVTRAEPFPETNKEAMMKLWIDIGDETVQSAAQLGHRYDPPSLVGTQLLCATNLDPMTIAGFTSEALTVGVPDDDGAVILLRPDSSVAAGATLF